MKQNSGKACKQSFTEVLAVLKVISDENRLRILCLLNAGERCVCEIWPELDIPQNLASHHLKMLKTVGLITSRKDGLRVFYSVVPEKMNQIEKVFTLIFRSHALE